ncbi:hypothetical protein ACWGJ2_00040 [Streptomyces sp. NPDC054796]
MADMPAAAHRLPQAVGAFTAELRWLTALLHPGEGWYGVFVGNDPAGMRECLEGREIPPWDVVVSLIQDLVGRHGQEAGARAGERLRARYADSVAAYDDLAGGEPVLRERLDAARRERDEAARRVRDLVALPGGSGTDLAWARDHHARASARCTELTARLAASRTRAAGAAGAAGAAPPGAQAAPVDGQGPRHEHSSDEGAGLGHDHGDGHGSGAGAGAASGKRDKWRGRPRGSRFAGVVEEGAEGADDAPVPSLVPPGAPGVVERAPRGARFAGAVDVDGAEGADEAPAAYGGPGADEEEWARARGAAAGAVARMARLREAGRPGETHVVLCEAAAWPALHLAAMARELADAGLDADVATLLWEAASLPPAALAAAADALAATGRAEDCAQLLRQGVARPVEEVSATALALHGAGRGDEAAQLLSALVRARTPVEVAAAAHADPATLVPSLLDAARAVSPHHYRSVANALRGTGLPGVPEPGKG